MIAKPVSEEEYEDYMADDYDDGSCPECGDEGSGLSGCFDDLCHGGDVPCMHGDYRMLPCSCCGK
jgi:hypothetical protein